MPAAAQEQQDSERLEKPRGRGAARAASELHADAEANGAPAAERAHPSQEMQRDRVQRQAQPRSAGRGFDYGEAADSRRRMRSDFDQQERAREAAQRQTQLRSRADERQRNDAIQRGTAQQHELMLRQQQELMLRQQRGLAERDAAQRSPQYRQQDRDTRGHREREHSPLVADGDHLQQRRRLDVGNGGQSHDRLDRMQQERRITEERQRAQRYHRQHDTDHLRADQRARQLQLQQRMSQYRYQQQYSQRLRLQRARWNSGYHDYYRDPYYYTPASYRYSYGGRWNQTNRYGADLMRQAVDYGYREGLRAGRADRHDQWRSDYRNSYAYQDASYGYDGYYVDQDTYSHYFRQGFQRGYQDAYSDRYRYGRRNSDGEYSVIAAVVTSILGLQFLR